MERIEVGGLDVAYERVGAGPALVLLNGYLGDGRATFQPQLDGLSDEFTIVAWDAPGCGASSDPPATFRLPDYADCLAAFIGALGLRRPHVGGLSLGGALAIEFYGRHPAVPRSLVLMSAYAGWAGSLSAEEAEFRLQQAIDLSELQPEELVTRLLPTMFSPDAPEHCVLAMGRSMGEFHPEGFRAMARSSAEADLRPVLPRIDVPTLLLYGSIDTRAPQAVALALHEAIPQSELVIIEGVGHILTLEAAEQCNGSVRRFLRDV